MKVPQTLQQDITILLHTVHRSVLASFTHYSKFKVYVQFEYISAKGYGDVTQMMSNVHAEEVGQGHMNHVRMQLSC